MAFPVNTDPAPRALAPIERRTLNEIAYERLKKALLSGRLEPGRVLTLRGLAAELGTSVMPVRDAIGRLAGEQALELVPNRGIRIPRLTAEQAEEVWRLRIHLEGEAAGLAAQRVTPGELTEIRRLHQLVAERARDGDLHAMLDANDSFQFAVYRAAKTRVLIQLIETLRMQSMPHCVSAFRRMIDAGDPFLDQSLACDSGLVLALEKRDARRARDVKRQDLEGIRQWVENALPGRAAKRRAKRGSARRKTG
jgi:DNA-binding GntR family transcriptional regulator